MAESGWVTRAEAEQASKDDLVVQAAPSRAKYQDADYFVEEVRERALNTIGEKLTEGGYYMRTTLDPRLQTAARSALMQGLENYDHRHGWRGAWATTDLAPGWEKAAITHAAPAERRAWRAAAIMSEAPVRVRLAEGGEGDLEAADVAWAKAGRGLHRGDLVWVEPSTAGRYHLRQVPQVNGALVAMDPYTGRVLAMVGGYSFSLSNFNRATQAMRQPGSAFKPFVYATALQNGYTPARIVLDAPITLQGNKPGETWSPQNYEGDFLGPLPFRRGLELSLNAMTVRIAQSVGMKKIADNAIKAGVVDHMDPVLAMSLGAGETTPFRLTAAYSAFVNGGYKVQPHLIELVEDREGKTIFKADQRACPTCKDDYAGEDSPQTRYARPASVRPDHRLSDQFHAAGRGAAGHRRPGALPRPPPRRQDRHHQRVPQRLVRRLFARHGGGRLRRLRRQPLLGRARNRRGGCGADLHRLHAAGAEGRACARLQGPDHCQIRHGQWHP